MDRQNSKGCQANLSPYLDYLNQLNNYNSKICKHDDLCDGLIIYEIMMRLKIFENQEKCAFVDQPTTFIHSLTNLKLIIRLIQKYWSKQLKRELFIDKQIDLIKISKNKDQAETQKLVALFVRTLFHSEEKQKFIEKMLQTHQKTQEFFMKILQETIKQNSNEIQATSTNDSIYTKLIELEHQNERLLSLLNEVCEEKEQIRQKQKQLEQKLDQRQGQLKKFNWQITQLTQFKRVPLECSDEESMHYLEGKKQNEKLKKQLKQCQEIQKTYIDTIESWRAIIQSQTKTIQTLTKDNQDSRFCNETNLELYAQIRRLSQTILSSEQSLSQKCNQLSKTKEQAAQKENQLKTLKQKVQKIEQELIIKQLLVQQLQDNIKYLTSQDLSSEEGKNFNISQQKSSINKQCRQTLQRYQYKTCQSMIMKMRRQMQNLTCQIQSCHTIVQNQEKQIEKLKLYEEENKKLVQMISHMNKYRGEENQVLVKCLYKMRVKLLGKQLKQKNQNFEGKSIGRPLQQAKNLNY